jgi:diadenosine tetraphosphate (Ap4A) HIT family hydrolase
MIHPKDCLGCQVSNGDKVPFGGFIHADDLWTVNHVLPPATILGWLVLQPRRHIEALHEMSLNEEQRMSQLMVSLDQVLRDILSPKKVYTCLFAESEYCPHIHFHIIPRSGDINLLGPEIFNYKPQSYPSDESILEFINLAKLHLSDLMKSDSSR